MVAVAFLRLKLIGFERSGAFYYWAKLLKGVVGLFMITTIFEDRGAL